MYRDGVALYAYTGKDVCPIRLSSGCHAIEVIVPTLAQLRRDALGFLPVFTLNRLTHIGDVGAQIRPRAERRLWSHCNPNSHPFRTISLQVMNMT
jgi:hypothetical protein